MKTELTLRQSYISVIASSSLTMYEQRLLLFLVKFGQSVIKGVSLSVQHQVLEHSFNMQEIIVPIADIISDGSSHYEQVKKAAISLTRRDFQYIDVNGNITYTKWVMRVTHLARSGQLKLIVDKSFFDTLYNFKKGFCYYDFVRAISLKHPQSVKIYQLINGMQSQGIRYHIDSLKRAFGVADKYARNNDFVRKYIEVARQELEASGEGNYFRYNVVKENNKITYIEFFPIKRATSAELQASAKGVTSWLETDMFKLLMYHGGFTPKQLNSNKALLSKLQTRPNAMDIILNIIERCRRKRPANPQGYIINALKSELK